MTLKVIGAGLGRTGTTSLKLALETLLGGQCYHMSTIFEQPEHVAYWHQASLGQFSNWDELFKNYRTVTDWPASAFYRELMKAFPDARVLLSRREPEAWLKSCRATIFPRILSGEGEWGEMIRSVVYTSFTDTLDDDEACMQAFERHNQSVIDTVPAERLILWEPGAGWGPLCAGLGLPIPDTDYPHANTTEDFLSRIQS